MQSLVDDIIPDYMWRGVKGSGGAAGNLLKELFQTSDFSSAV